MGDSFEKISNKDFIQYYITFAQVNGVMTADDKGNNDYKKKCQAVQNEKDIKWKPKDKWKLQLLTVFLQINPPTYQSPDEELFKSCFLDSYAVLTNQIKLYLEIAKAPFERDTKAAIDSINSDFIKSTTLPERVKNSFNSIDKIFHKFFFLVYCACSVIFPYQNKKFPTSSSLKSTHNEISRYLKIFERDYAQFGLSPEVLFHEFAKILKINDPNYNEIFFPNDDQKNGTNEENTSKPDDESSDDENRVDFGSISIDGVEEDQTEVESLNYTSDLDSIIACLDNLIKTFNGFLSDLRDQFFNLQCHWFDLFLQSVILIPSKNLITHDIFELFTAPSIQEAKTQDEKDKLREQTFTDLLSIIQNSKSLISLSEFSNALISLFDKTLSSLANQCSLFTLVRNENDINEMDQNQTMNDGSETNASTIKILADNIDSLIEHVNSLFSPFSMKTSYKEGWYKFSKIGSALIHNKMGTDFTVETMYTIISNTINKFHPVDLQFSAINEVTKSDISNLKYNESQFVSESQDVEEEEEEAEIIEEEEEENDSNTNSENSYGNNSQEEGQQSEPEIIEEEEENDSNQNSYSDVNNDYDNQGNSDTDNESNSEQYSDAADDEFDSDAD